MSDVTFDMRDNSMEVHQNATEPWRVTLVDTGAETQTGGRIKRVAQYVGDETFMLTYGDGVADVDIAQAARVPPGARQAGDGHGGAAARALRRAADRRGSGDGPASAPAVRAFQEKPMGDGAWINGGFFVLEPAVLDRIEGDDTPFEGEPARERWPPTASCGPSATAASGSPWTRCATSGALEALWDSGEAPWKVWNSSHRREPH